MTPIFICGAECQVNVFGTVGDSNEHWDAKIGTVTVDTGVFDSLGGAASWKLNGAGAGLQRNVAASATLVLRMRFRAASGFVGLIAALANSTASNIGYANISADNGDGTFVLQVTVGNNINVEVALAYDAWHTLDFKMTSSGGTDTATARVNGGADASDSTSVTSHNLSAVIVGDQLGINSGIFYADAILCSATSADYPIGAGKVIGYVPQSTSGTHNQTAGDLKNSSASNVTNADASGTAIDEVPANTTDYINQAVIRTTTYYEGIYNTASETGVPRGVEQVVSFFMGSAASGSHKSQLYDGTGAADAYATTGFSNTAISNRTKCWATAPSGGAWTNAKLVAARIRWGFSSDVTPQPRLSSTILEAEFAVVAAHVPRNPAVNFQHPAIV